MNELRIQSHGLCKFIWVLFVCLAGLVLFVGDISVFPWLQPVSVFATVLTLIWAIWSTPAPPYRKK